MRLLLLIISVFMVQPIFAKKFANTYLEFNIPDTWHCKPEGGQHICQPINPEQRREAIIVMASKYKGPGDDMKQYFARLKEKRRVKDLKGKSYSSKVQYTKFNSILGTAWVDSQHENSEVPGFITRYLATVSKGLGIAITFSAHSSKFKQYGADFYRMIKSIKVRENIPIPQEAHTLGKEPVGRGVILGKLGSKRKKSNKSGKQVAKLGDMGDGEDSDNNDIILLIGGIIAILGLYIFIRRRRT